MMPGWALGLMLEMLISVVILVIGLRRDSVVMIVMGGAWFLFPLAFFALLPAFLAGPEFRRASVFCIWYALVGGIWALMAFFGFKYLDRGKGKALVVFAILWSFILPAPLTEACEWPIEIAYLTTFSLTGVGYVIMGFIVKRVEAAKARKESSRMRILNEID